MNCGNTHGNINIAAGFASLQFNNLSDTCVHKSYDDVVNRKSVYILRATVFRFTYELKELALIYRSMSIIIKKKEVVIVKMDR